MNIGIDKGRLAMNLIIYVIISVVLTAIFAATGTDDSLGPQIIAGFSGSLLLYIPVRLFPRLGLIGSIIVLLVISFLFVGVMSLLGETIGSIVALVLLLDAFISSLLFL